MSHIDMLPRIAAYICVSTDDQVEFSPDAKLVEIRKYAASHGYILPQDYIFVDEGISGKHTQKRPEFNRMIGTIKTKLRPFDAIELSVADQYRVCHYLDGTSRPDTTKPGVSGHFAPLTPVI